MKISFVMVAMALLGAGACAQQPVDQVASLPLTGTEAFAEGVPGPSVYNSDNRPTVMRSGLNSDPYNPNGAPGAGSSSIVP